MDNYLSLFFFSIPGFYALFFRLGDFPRIVISLSGVNILSSLPLYLLPFTLSLSMPLSFTLSFYIPFTSLSLSLSLISPSLSISLLLSFSLSLSLSNVRFRPCFHTKGCGNAPFPLLSLIFYMVNCGFILTDF